MIPTITQILEDYKAGVITLAEAIRWMDAHLGLAREESTADVLRDSFAMAALQGMVAGSQGLHITTEQFAIQSFALADAMLRAR